MGLLRMPDFALFAYRGDYRCGERRQIAAADLGCDILFCRCSSRTHACCLRYAGAAAWCLVVMHRPAFAYLCNAVNGLLPLPHIRMRCAVRCRSPRRSFVAAYARCRSFAVRYLGACCGTRTVGVDTWNIVWYAVPPGMYWCCCLFLLLDAALALLLLHMPARHAHTVYAPRPVRRIACLLPVLVNFLLDAL